MTAADWKIPGARVVLRAGNDNTPEWLEERQHGVGGTDAATVMGVNLYEDPAGLLERKLGPTPENVRSPILDLGHAMEDRLARQLEEQAGIRTRRAGLLRPKDPERAWQYANPDRLTSDGGIAEFKTAGWSSRAGRTWMDGRIPDHAFVQAQHYLDVTGRSHVWFSVGIRNDRAPWQDVPRRHWSTDWFADLAIEEWIVAGPIQRDEDLIATIRETGERFTGCVDRGQLDELFTAMLPVERRYPSPVDGKTTEPLIAEAAQQDLDRYRAILVEERALKDEKDSIADRVKGMIGDAETLTIDGAPVATWKASTRTSLDRKGLEADHPDLAAKYTNTTVSRSFMVKKAGAR